MKRFFSLPIRTQLAALIIGSVLASLLFTGGILTYVSFQAQLAQLNQTQQAQAQVVAEKINAYFDDLQRKLTFLARIRGLTVLSRSTQYAILEGLGYHNSAYEVVGLTDAEGRLLQSFSKTGEVAPTDWGTTVAFRRAFQEQEDYFGEVEILPGQAWPTLLLAEPVRDADNQVAGMLFARVNLKFLWAILEETQVGTTGYVYLLNPQQVVVAESDHNRWPTKFAGLAPTALGGQLAESSSYPEVYRGLYDDPVLGTVADITSANWHVVVELPVQEAYTPLYNLLGVMGVGLVLGGVFFGALGLVLARQITQPLGHLAQAATQFSRGVLATRVVIEPDNELKVLAEAFNQMAAHLSDTIQQLQQDVQERQQAEAALAESNARFLRLADNITGYLAYLNATTLQYEFVNSAFEKAFGRPGIQIIGSHLREIIGEANFQVALPYIAAVRAGQAIAYENIFELNSGQRWGQVNYAPVFDANGQVMSIAVLSYDITERKQAEAALQESETRLKFAQRIAQVGHWTWDIMTNQVLWSDEMKRIFGLDPTTFAGDLSRIIEQAIHPDDRAKVQQSNAAVVTEQKPLPLEYRVVWPDGSVHTIWAEPGEKILAADGKILQLSGIVQDITARKQAEEQIRTALQEKEVMLREIYHRVKNNLMVVQSLVELQAAQTTLPEATALFQDLGHRVMAMAMVHEALYQSENLAQIDFAMYLERLTLNLWHSFARADVQPRIVAAQVFLDLYHATPCGLIVAELVTNALKYAFPLTHPTGGAEICVEMYSTATHYTLQISDNGVGLPPNFDWRATKTLGLELVRGWAEHQLRGTVTIGGPPGTRWIITFPKPKTEHSSPG